MPILEWRDLKVLPDPTSSNPYPYAPNPSNPSILKPEGLGCWSTRKPSEGEPIRAENVVNHIGVDVSYTRVPPWTRLKPDDKEGDHVVLPQLAALIYPRTSSSSSPIPPPSEFRHLYMAPAPQGHAGLPESQMACFDTMYYSTSGAEVFEWRFGWSPVWRTVGKYLRFKEDSTVMRVARSYLRGLFGSVRDEKENEGDSVEEDHESNGEQEGDMVEEIPPVGPLNLKIGTYTYLLYSLSQSMSAEVTSGTYVERPANQLTKIAIPRSPSTTNMSKISRKNFSKNEVLSSNMFFSCPVRSSLHLCWRLRSSNFRRRNIPFLLRHCRFILLATY